MPDKDAIRAAAVEWWNDNVMPADVSWHEAKENLVEFICAEVERERERCIDEMKPYISETYWGKLARDIRQGGA